MISVVVKLLPLSVNEVGPVVVFRHVAPKPLRAVAERTGVAAALMVKVWVLETAAAPVVVTPTDAEPAVAISAALISAVNWVALTKVVVRLLPFQVTVD